MKMNLFSMLVLGLMGTQVLVSVGAYGNEGMGPDGAPPMSDPGFHGPRGGRMGGQGLQAGPQGGPQGPRGGMQFSELLFAPDLVERNQEKIHLTDKQREQIMKEISNTQKQVMEAQWTRKKSPEELNRILAQTKVDEKEALRVLNQIAGEEAEIKKAHMTLLIRIKNILTKEQQEQLEQIKHIYEAPMGPMGQRPMPMGQPQ